MSLSDIAQKVLDPFSIDFRSTAVVLAEMSKTFSKTTVEPNTTVKQILSDLSAQRNIHMTHHPEGEIVFTRFNRSTSIPAHRYEYGERGLRAASLTINSQNLHSSITAMRQATRKNPDSAEATVSNPYMTLYKPRTVLVNSGDNEDVDKAARAALSQELSRIRFRLSVIEYQEPGTTIELKYEEMNLNRFTELFVQETILSVSSGGSDQITLICVPVDVYTDTTPQNIFTL